MAARATAASAMTSWDTSSSEVAVSSSPRATTQAPRLRTSTVSAPWTCREISISLLDLGRRPAVIAYLVRTKPARTRPVTSHGAARSAPSAICNTPTAIRGSARPRPRPSCSGRETGPMATPIARITSRGGDPIVSTSAAGRPTQVHSASGRASGLLSQRDMSDRIGVAQRPGRRLARATPGR